MLLKNETEYHGVARERATKILNAMRVELRTSVEVPRSRPDNTAS